ncbi:hypothetical protein P168DRAFT_292070 [Aspergillus campestris IBT 28561]|uniref:Uncharacterized protein n=1 Tax=Aspergillus campestris (strain IBT 28561) TaxID=1392248 RepID=A0A2I1CWC9_ASPC2|nr:uncharacterized protein P168DRAFT_292070 [Aspergillus campestris IBT 28561]PKY01927.1 hypothetical protein P168DRAFT_292070 [Aspergillus campestris IBT 28561]
MGIPMFHESTSAEVPKSNPIKDPCAAARSTIRRQGAIHRQARPGSALRSATLRPPFPRPLADEIEREASGLQRPVRSPFPDSSYGEDLFDLANGFVDSSSQSTGQRLLNEVLRHSRPTQRLRLPRIRPLLRDEVASGQPDLQSPNFTPRFAPAVAYSRTESPRPQSHPPPHPHPHPEVLRLSPFPRPGGDVSVGSTVPLLRQVGQRSINEPNGPNRDTAIDGLGDRQRSVSPDDDHANNAWETLLTTITPDANLPSADSSFTSASASGTNASTNGTSRSSATSFGNLPSSLDPSAATVHMVLDPYPELSNPCDYSSTDSDSDSESGFDLTHQSLYRRYRRMRRMDAMRRAQNLNSAMNTQPPIPAFSFALSDSSTDPDLQQMHAILDRLARREDIPENWWAAAGLSRIIGHRLGAEANESSNGSDRPEPRR